MTTGTNGAHVEVTVRMGDPLTVTDEPCHRGRYFGAAIVREMLSAFGVKVCPDCYRYVGLAERTERPLRRKGWLAGMMMLPEWSIAVMAIGLAMMGLALIGEIAAWAVRRRTARTNDVSQR